MAEEAKSTRPAPEAAFSSDQSVVWEKILKILEDHELPLESSDQAAGTLKTRTKRYFKISSARFPPVQRDFRDAYTIQLASSGPGTRVTVERKFEVFDSQKNDWVDGDPVKEKAGLSVEAFFKQLKSSLGESQ